MSTKPFLAGLCLLCGASLCAAAEDVPVTGTLKIKGQTYKFNYARAFRITSEGKDAVAVIVSPEPVHIRNPKLFPKEEQRWISLFSISGKATLSDDEIDWAVPHVQVIYDVKTGELVSYSGWALDRTFIGRHLAGFRGKAKSEGKIVSGTGESKNLLGDDRDQSFEFTFTAPLEHIDLPQIEDSILSTPLLMPSTPPPIPSPPVKPNKEFDETGIPPSPK